MISLIDPILLSSIEEIDLQNIDTISLIDPILLSSIDEIDSQNINTINDFTN
jgi:hypothetical protein